jgi:transcription antitermination protein NusB
MTKIVRGRHGSRWLALQGLYAWQNSRENIAKIEADLLAGDLQFNPQDFDEKVKIAFDKAYFHELLTQIYEQGEELDTELSPHLDRDIQEVTPIERAILWIGAYELKVRLEIPYKVILNEAIMLAKQFGAQDSHKFVNGVLDKMAKQIRANELA